MKCMGWVTNLLVGGITTSSVSSSLVVVGVVCWPWASEIMMRMVERAVRRLSDSLIMFIVILVVVA